MTGRGGSLAQKKTYMVSRRDLSCGEPGESKDRNIQGCVGLSGIPGMPENDEGSISFQNPFALPDDEPFPYGNRNTGSGTLENHA